MVLVCETMEICLIVDTEVTTESIEICKCLSYRAPDSMWQHINSHRIVQEQEQQNTAANGSERTRMQAKKIRLTVLSVGKLPTEKDFIGYNKSFFSIAKIILHLNSE